MPGAAGRTRHRMAEPRMRTGRPHLILKTFYQTTRPGQGSDMLRADRLRGAGQRRLRRILCALRDALRSRSYQHPRTSAVHVHTLYGGSCRHPQPSGHVHTLDPQPSGIPTLSTLNPQSCPHPEPSTLSHAHTLGPQSSAMPTPSTLNLQSCSHPPTPAFSHAHTLNPQPSTLIHAHTFKPQPSVMPTPSTLNPQSCSHL